MGFSNDFKIIYVKKLAKRISKMSIFIIQIELDKVKTRRRLLQTAEVMFNVEETTEHKENRLLVIE